MAKNPTAKKKPDDNPLAGTLRLSTRQFEEKISELSLLRRVGDIVGFIFNQEKFFQMFLDIILEETGADNCSFMVMDGAAGALQLKCARGKDDSGTFFDDTESTTTAFTLGEGVCGRVAQTRKAVLIEDVQQYKPFTQKQTAPAIGSLICAPLIHQERLLGVINISHTEPGAFTQGNKRVMEVMCSFVSSIIGNAVEYIKSRDEEKFRAMFEGVKLAVLLIDPESSRVVECNKYAQTWLGHTRRALLAAESFFDFVDREHRNTLEEVFRETIKKGRSGSYELSFICKTGVVCAGELSGTVIHYKEGAVLHITIKDVTERKVAQEALRKSEEKYYSLIEHANEAIVSINRSGVITGFNKKAEEMYGYSRQEIMGTSAAVLAPPSQKHTQDRYITNLSSGNMCSVSETPRQGMGCRKDGTEFPIEASYFALQIQGEEIITALIRDISERQALEKKLLQSEKLRSLGELAGGVAHDFNNMLAAILGRVQLLRRFITVPPNQQEKRKTTITIREGLEIIEKAALDGAETVRRIQEFCKSRDNQLVTVVNINDVIEDALEFTRMKWKDEAEAEEIKIDVRKHFASVPAITGNPSELRELFTNLINNAVDAMPSGGTITITTKPAPGQDSVEVTFVDTGIGIEQDALGSIFDPFFTTKGVHSTGLGLSVSYGIINRHQGTIEVNSDTGSGTSFSMTFPVATHFIPRKKNVTRPTEQLNIKTKILIAEDEEELRDMFRDILEAEGHEVETTENGKQALALFRQKPFDMVFTDLGMPGMSGWQVAQEIKSQDPSIPVCLITGWNIELSEAEMKQRGITSILHKPVKIDELLHLVHLCKDRSCT